MPNVSEWILIFTIYSFWGWVCECIYCSVPAKKLINRGFLAGPFCPVYGFGGILVVSLLTPFQYSIPLLYIAGMLTTSLLEYFASLLLEKLFHTKWWDYSHYRFHIQGRVCLVNSLLFGAMSVVVILFLHPSVLKAIHMIPVLFVPPLAVMLTLYFLVDTVVTVRTILLLNGKVAELQQILDELREHTQFMRSQYLRGVHERLEGILGNIDSEYKLRMQSLQERQSKLENGCKHQQRRMLRAFPHMASTTRNNESLCRLKVVLKAHRKSFLDQRKTEADDHE